MDLKDWMKSSLPAISEKLENLNLKFCLEDTTIGLSGRAKVVHVIELLKTAVFPEVYEKDATNARKVKNLINSSLEAAARELSELIEKIMEYQCRKKECHECKFIEMASTITMELFEALPSIREMLQTDVQAAFDGDPAARFTEEILLSYPSIEALTVYRFAHFLYGKQLPIIPRIMTEYAHQRTGIDINPGAKIGRYCFIDHGTGVVIGETATIGDHVKIYQGVTLGAKSFPLDECGNPIKGNKRHPDIEDNVVIYAGATILGGDTRIGHDSEIGGNVWLTQSVPPYSTVYNAQPSPIIKQKKC